MHLESEAPVVINDNRPSAHWPNVGKVELENLQVNSFPCSQNYLFIIFQL